MCEVTRANSSAAARASSLAIQGDRLDSRSQYERLQAMRTAYDAGRAGVGFDGDLVTGCESRRQRVSPCSLRVYSPSRSRCCSPSSKLASVEENNPQKYVLERRMRLHFVA